MCELSIYTDVSGAKKAHGVGVLFIEGEKEVKTKFKVTNRIVREDILPDNILDMEDKRLRHKYTHDKLSVHEYECYAILQALRNIDKDKKYDYINLYTDSLCSFDYINENVKIKKSVLELIASECRTLANDKNVDIMWIKAHVNVYGNTIVDKLARAGRRVPINMIETI
jgi:ribonuclease HI